MLDRIGRIKTYSFTMKDDPKRQTEFGVVAQEMRDIFPELVKEDHSANRYLSVNYVGLIAPLIEANKELERRNRDLREQVAANVEEVSRLKADQAKMRGEMKAMQEDVRALMVVTGASMAEDERSWNRMLVLVGLGGAGLCVVLLAWWQRRAASSKGRGGPGA